MILLCNLSLIFMHRVFIINVKDKRYLFFNHLIYCFFIDQILMSVKIFEFYVLLRGIKYLLTHLIYHNSFHI